MRYRPNRLLTSMFFGGPVARRLRAVSGMKQVSQRIRIFAREGTHRCRSGNLHPIGSSDGHFSCMSPSRVPRAVAQVMWSRRRTVMVAGHRPLHSTIKHNKSFSCSILGFLASLKEGRDKEEYIYVCIINEVIYKTTTTKGLTRI